MLLKMMMENTSSQITNISSSSQGFGYDMNAGCTENEKNVAWVEEADASFNAIHTSVRHSRCLQGK